MITPRRILALLALATVAGACNSGDGGGGQEPPPPPADIDLLASVPVPANYGIHDTFVRDGLAFVSAWNTGLIILDVGHGIRGGTPSLPAEVSRIVPPPTSTPCVCIHNAWWFHHPNGEKRYVFLGQEGPGTLGAKSSGDINVIDVSDLTSPQLVATFHLVGAGVHNFSMDEARGILYAAYYNAGVLALDVNGTLSGALEQTRPHSTVRPGGDVNTFTWGVQYVPQRDAIYASDMESGFWQIEASPGPSLRASGGGFNVPSRWTSELWVHGDYGYSGTWGAAMRNGNFGNALYVWQLGPTGAPTLADSVIFSFMATVSDLEVSADGRHLLVTGENGAASGLYLFSLANPAKPSLVAFRAVSTGLHTGTFAEIGGRRYVFAAKNPGGPALLIFDVTSHVQ